MKAPNWQNIEVFSESPENILARRTEGIVYSADFRSGEGKYISTSIKSDEPVDAVLKISPRIELRFTYIFNEKEICGIQISKLNSKGVLDKIHLSTMDWGGVLTLLHIFSNVDLESIAKGSLILDSSIIGDKEKLEKFLSTIAADPEGKKKFEEVANNFGLLKSGDVDQLARRISNVSIMCKMLDNEKIFNIVRDKFRVKKNEEVWQKFFQKNDWMLGAEAIDILKDRDIDEESIVDLPVKSLDGFLDIVELKLPTAELWNKDGEITSELAKASMQCARYISEYELRANDHKKIKSLGVDILKPRITLIYGRSKDWEEKLHKQLRVLNSSYHNITILTYDHVLQRATKIVEINKEKKL